MNYSGAPNDASEVGLGYSACVKIGSDDVIFDCNGYNITHNGAGSSAAIVINGTSATTYDNITIRNCDRIYNYDNGIVAYNATSVNISNVTTNDTNTAGILFIHTYDSQVVDSNIIGAGDNIRLEYSDYNLLSRNDLSSCWTHCTYTIDYSDHNIVSHNTAHDFSFFGYTTQYVSNITFFNNTAYRGDDACFWIEWCTNCSVINNTAQDCDDGFRTPDSRFVGQDGFTNNTAYNNTAGFYFGGAEPGSYIHDNLAYNNTGNGFTVFMSNGVTLERNTAYGNGGSSGGFRTSNVRNVTLRSNIAYENSASGFNDAGTFPPLVNVSFISNIAYLNGQDGFSLYGRNRTFVNNTAHSNARAGVYAKDLDNVTFNGTHIYNNTYDMIINSTDATARTLNASHLVFDTPLGTYQNFTNLSFGDSFNSANAYFINWTTNNIARPSSRTSFREKFVNITPMAGGPSINNISWHWSESELAGYTEDEFELWKYNTTVGWVMISSTPDTVNNFITTQDFLPGSDYGILQSPVNCPVIDTPGTFTQPMNYIGAPNDASEVAGGAKACVKIAASDVVYDCNGYDIYSGIFVAAGSHGILLNASAQNVTVKNCTLVSGYTYGVHVFNSDNNLLANITTFNSTEGFRISSSINNTIANSTARNNTDGMAVWYGRNNTIIESIAVNQTWNGFMMFDTNNVSLINNTAYWNGIAGFHIEMVENASVTDNVAFENTASGFTLDTDVRNCTFTLNRAHSNLGSGMFITSNSDENTFIRNSAYNNSAAGMGADWNSDGGVYLNNSVYNNSGSGLRILRANYSNLTGNIAANNSQNGFYLIVSNSTVLEHNTATGNTLSGFYDYRSKDNNYTDNTAHSNLFAGFYIRDSDNNNISHTRLYNNTCGLIMNSTDATARDTTIEYMIFDNPTGSMENFTNLSIYDQFSAAGAYMVNWTLNSSGLPANRLSFEDKLVNISRASGSGSIEQIAWHWTESELAGYNESLFELWKYNVSDGWTLLNYSPDTTGNTLRFDGLLPESDYGILENQSLADFTNPNGSITIYGINGTDWTGSRSVMLDCPYSDDIAIGLCRWANDNLANLLTAPWENCTAVKAWILSTGFGNKTVYFQVNDSAGNTNISNDTIYYNFTQDYTPPTPPVVYDGLSGDHDWWNSDNTLHANWFNATDDISNTIYYQYRIIENASCYNNDCNFTSAGANTSVSVTDLSLNENWVYSFDVRACNDVELCSPAASSNGTRIDITDPDMPIVNSTTHPDQDTAYPTIYADLNWTAEDILSAGNRSGIEGHSYLLDRHPGTAPDNTMDNRYWETLNQLRNNGYAQLLRANSTVASPHTYAVFSQIKTNITENDSIRVRVALAELSSDLDDLVGISVYLISDSNGFDITSFLNNDLMVSDNVTLFREIRYADSMIRAETYEFNLTVNTTVDDSTDDIYVVVAGLTSDTDNRHNHSIAGSDNQAHIDESTWAFVCDNTDSCNNVTDTTEFAIEVARVDSGDEWEYRYDNLGDDVYYFHVKARDKAGNWGNTSHYRITVAAGGVSVGISSPVDGQIFTTEGTEVNISVNVLVTGNASVWVVAEHPDGNNFTSSQEVFSIKHLFENITLKLGQNRLFAVANTSAGVITYSSSVYVIVDRGWIPLSNKTLRVAYAACAESGTRLCYQSEGSYYVGVANEDVGSVPGGGGYAEADTTINSIKIFMSRQFDVGDVTGDFTDNEFLDNVNPSFGYSKETKDFIVQNQLRYEDIFVGGDLRLAPGKYNIYLNHHGVTEDGRVNLSISIR
jgi:parallel beta-helix repeat protein